MQNPLPLVTIICTSYNHEKYVKNCLDSILNQEYANIQLILVDDCSTDNSFQIMLNWLKQIALPNLKYWRNQRNLGLNKSFNQALLQADGDYIMDLAADDILFPKAIKNLVEKFQQSSFQNCGIVFGNTQFIKEDHSWIKDYLPKNQCPPTGKITEAMQGAEFELCTVSALYKKEVYQILNGYDESLMYEDLDFWIRATRLFEVDYTPEFIVKRIVHKKSLESYFYHPFHFKAFQINWCTLKVLKKAFFENQSNQFWNRALLKRVKHEQSKFKWNWSLWFLYQLLIHRIKESLKS
jgi:glycosyltransferase involved in cell wall biosynthesis